MGVTGGKDRVVVVTGASHGVGVETAAELLGQGANVVLAESDRAWRASRVRELVEAFGRDRVLAQRVDVTDAFALLELRDTVHERFGTVDAVVVGVGVASWDAFEDAVPGEWASMLNTNVSGMLQTAHVFARDLIESATDGVADLLFVGALVGSVAYPRWSVFAAVSAAIGQLAVSLRQELGPRGVRVHQVQPGLTEVDGFGYDGNARTRRAWNSLIADLPPVPVTTVAHVITAALQLPAHVNLADMVIIPTGQDARLPTRLGVDIGESRR
ncbi:SDR family oxidoreductase [Xylanimonas ulmi]|uniref:NADP-dependent 3-hydroxy acid dehydrogenase YdfG n=1 Tax=Xylanimonas ulmi TaxID=228973 RepID=A0A4Q7M2R4_9MICO|nr:SDR family NAD(P)-dependent oxidoreductase [Xylanibacterium ulmi]RZS60199.1 NADP-dependent 3-hydroxy acid dehydrogenase YdfG [Xylanibacterium ulmi]